MRPAVIYPDQENPPPSTPAYFETQSANLVGFVPAGDRRLVAPSQMFTIKLMLDEYARANPGQSTLDASQGDGGASLGPISKAELVTAIEAFLSDTATTAYGPAGGRKRVREDAFHHWWDLDATSGLDPDRIVFANGGRNALQMWYMIVRHLDGTGSDVIVSSAPWGSYPQALFLNHLNLLCASGNVGQAFRLTPDAIREAVEFSRGQWRLPSGLILTTPDNPTGNTLSFDELVALIETATELGIPHILVDLMYQAVSTTGRYDIARLWTTLTPAARDRVTCMDGLTKCAGASNVRNAHLLLGNATAAKLALALSTHVDFVNDFGMALAASVYGLPDPADHVWIRRVVEPTNRSRAIAVEAFARHGIRCIADQGYYAFVNVWPWLGRPIPRDLQWEDAGHRVTHVANVATLVAYLAKKHGVAVIPGSAFRQPNFVRFSVANAPDYTAAAVERFASALRTLS